MHADDLVTRAQERTGLTEFDDESFREGLGILVEEIEVLPGVVPGGRDWIYGFAVDMLANRLQVNEYLRNNPELLDSPIERPLVILGMPRTGTTAVSHMLALDPARRSLLNWEPMNVVPPATTETLKSDPRCLAARKLQQDMLDQGTEMAALHWEWADEPTEDSFIVQQDFKAELWQAYLPSRRYADWLWYEADLVPTYQYEKRVLQVLQSKTEGTWSLKMPSHAKYIDFFLAVFPDARLVWTHRDPYKVTGSLCNLIAFAEAALLGENVDIDYIAERCPMDLSEHVNRLMRARERIGHDRVFDLHYADLLRDPMTQIQSLYEWAGDPLEPEVEAGMRQWLVEHPQNKFGKVAYSLEDFELTRESLEPFYADYLGEYDIERED